MTKINAETANTGISAALDSATGKITLTETQSRLIKVDNIQIEGMDFSSTAWTMTFVIAPGLIPIYPRCENETQPVGARPACNQGAAAPAAN